eukprot:COSAG01_NODE_7058_length_3373_cov_1.332010_1_plen_170_part_10
MVVGPGPASDGAGAGKAIRAAGGVSQQLLVNPAVSGTLACRTMAGPDLAAAVSADAVRPQPDSDAHHGDTEDANIHLMQARARHRRRKHLKTANEAAVVGTDTTTGQPTKPQSQPPSHPDAIDEAEALRAHLEQVRARRTRRQQKPATDEAVAGASVAAQQPEPEPQPQP